MEELAYRIVKVHSAGDELVARVGNFYICKAAFEKALFGGRTSTSKCGRQPQVCFQGEADMNR